VPEAGLSEVFAAAGCEGFLHVRDLDGDGEVALGADTLVVSASVFKVAVALELFRQAAVGEVDLRERVRVDPADSLGAPAGLSLFSDEVEVSLRDLAVSMLTVSDALATDVLLEKVGLERVNALTRSLGLTETVVVGGIQAAFDSLAEDLGFADGRELLGRQWNDPAETARALELMRTARPCTPATATRTTPREMTTLLTAIWRDEAAPAEACSEVRSLMAKQLQRERVARGFRARGDRWSGKTGSFGGAFRNEVGVVELAAGGRYAIAVFTSAHELYERARDIDDAIGVAAALAVETLRAAS